MLNKSAWRNALYLLPAVLVYAVFLLLPLLASLGISFTEWDGTSLPIFTGISNYVRMFQDPVFWVALGNNALLMLFYTLLPIGVGLLLCSFLYETRNGKERSVLRILFFLPYIMPMAVLGVVWRWLYNPAFGPIDQFLRAIGLPQLALSWLGDFTWALPAVGFVATWYFFGFCLVLFAANGSFTAGSCRFGWFFSSPEVYAYHAALAAPGIAHCAAADGNCQPEGLRPGVCDDARWAGHFDHGDQHLYV